MQALPAEILGRPYMRAFQWDGWRYALGMPGVMYRSRDGLRGFSEGPALFAETMRHAALKLDGDTLSVFYTHAGDCPERILRSTPYTERNITNARDGFYALFGLAFGSPGKAAPKAPPIPMDVPPEKR